MLLAGWIWFDGLLLSVFFFPLRLYLPSCSHWRFFCTTDFRFIGKWYQCKCQILTSTRYPLQRKEIFRNLLSYKFSRWCINQTSNKSNLDFFKVQHFFRKMINEPDMIYALRDTLALFCHLLRSPSTNSGTLVSVIKSKQGIMIWNMMK